jgi:hypothetical protein
LTLTAKEITPAGIKLTCAVDSDQGRCKSKELNENDRAKSGNDMAELFWCEGVPEEDRENDGTCRNNPEEDLGA